MVISHSQGKVWAITHIKRYLISINDLLSVLYYSAAYDTKDWNCYRKSRYSVCHNW